MKNEGFTLVELLAVLLILAFIALIAVPQILNLIEQSKIRSLKLSTESYIRAVNTSLINEEVFNNVKDGLYTIADDGKKIVLGDREIYIASEGHGLKSGLLLIEDSKVKRVLKGMIDDYYVRVNGEEITILKNLNESTLVASSKFNVSIKTLVGDKDIDNATGTEKAISISTVDTNVKKITFLQDGVLPEGYTKEQLQQLKSTDLSKDNDNSIIGYYDEETGTIYVYSDVYISCPTNIGAFFRNFKGVEEIELNLIDTSKVINMAEWDGGLFLNCNNLKEIKGLEYIDTRNVTTMNAMFHGCSSLKSIDVSSFDTSRVTDMGSMFENCSSLETLDLSSFNTGKVTSIGYMFYDCTNLKEIKGLEKFDTSFVKSMVATFSYCSSLTSLDLTKWDARKVTGIVAWNGSIFKNCSNIKNIKFGKNFTLENVTAFNRGDNENCGMFSGCSNLLKLDISMFNTNKVTTMAYMFNGCSNLKEIKGLEKFDTSQVTNMSYMFQDCKSITSLDLTKWDTSSLTGSLWAMFRNCISLKEIKGIENFNTSNITNMCGMFNRCSSLESLDLSKWDTRKVTMINHFNTGGSIFQNCTNLKSIKFGENCTFEKVIYLGNMFNGCSSLVELDLTSFNISNITTLENMFSGCTNLNEIKVKGSKWDELKNTSGFRGAFTHVEDI